MTGTSTRLVGVMAVTLLVGVTTAGAQVGQMYGELVGKITDSQGAVLPGVTVSLSGPAVMGTQSTTTNTNGLYRFPAVTSGTYKLTFELPGFAPLVREGIVVPVRTTITVDAEMKVAAVQETVTVTGTSPVIDVENTKVGARLDNEILNAVPTSRSLFGSTTILPGMVMARQDPGGLNAATSTNMVAHGATSYNLNYYGVTADTPQDYGSMYYMDYGSAEEISVDTAAMGAEIGGGGGANINIIPKSGGNQVKGDVLYSLTGGGYWDGFTDNNITPELRAQGITDPTLQKLNDFNVNAGGPFIRDRFWWFGSLRNYSTVEATPGFTTVSPDGSLTNPFDSNLRNYTASSKYQLSRNNTLSGFWTFNQKTQPHRNAGVTQPNPVTTINQKSPKNLFNGNFTSIINERTFLEVSSSYFHMHWPSQYSDEFYALPDSQKTPATQNVTTGIFGGPEPTGERLRDGYRVQTNIGLTRYIDSWLGGNHQLKSGFENWYGWGSDEFRVFNDTRLRYRNVAGVAQPSEIYAYNTPLTQRTRMRNFAAFVQDRLSYSSVTLNLGLRWSYYDGVIPEQTGGGGRWFPQVTYPEIKTPYKWSTLAPRTGLTWKMTADGRNVAKAAYSRYFESMYTTEFDTINPNSIQTTGVATYTWFGDLNGNGTVDPGEYNPSPISVFTPRNNSIDPNLKDPKNDEIMFAFQREVMANVSFSAQWIQRWFSDRTVDSNIGIPLSGYAPRTFVDPGRDNILNTADDGAITAYDVTAQYRGKDVFMRINSPSEYQYKGLEMTLSKRMANRWQLLGSYVWSQLAGDLTSNASPFFGDPNNPNTLINANGRLTNDQPSAFKLLGSYQAPYGINLGGNYQVLTGLPRDRRISLPLAQGNTTILVEPRGTFRADTLGLLSFRADKSFTLSGGGTGRGRRASVVAEVHNVGNSSAGQNTYGLLTQSFASQAAFDAARLTTAYFGRVQEIVAPRIFKLGFRLEF